MSRPRRLAGRQAAALGLAVLVATASWGETPRLSNLVVTNSGQALVVSAVLLGSLPEGVREGLSTGIPATVRYQVELWQYNSWWVDRRLVAKLVERNVIFDVLTREYRVTASQGEQREPYVTRDIWEAERVLSELKTLSLATVQGLKDEDLYYVRARAEIRSGAPDASLSKILPFASFRVETTWVESSLLTLRRNR
jgi:hypothetical protein